MRRNIASDELLSMIDDLTLFDLIFDPPRADWMDLDGGGGEADVSDTAFAADRQFGFSLQVDDASWDLLVCDFDAEEISDEAIEAHYAQPVSLQAGRRD